MKAYSVDLRQRVLNALERGTARKEVVKIFAVSEGSIKRWQKLRREHTTLEPRRVGGQQPIIQASDEQVVRRLVAATPDATLEEYTKQWNELHERLISHWTLGRAIRRLGLTRKKRVSSRKSATAGNVRCFKLFKRALMLMMWLYLMSLGQTLT